jgi:digeranylgeranylglycerophospholipid reductase
VEAFDVVTVGAGPAGSTAARFAAEGGAKTLLVDQRAEIGYPVQCGEFLVRPSELKDLFPNAGSAIDRAYRIPAETILRETHRMVCVSPGGRRYGFPLEGVSVSRRSFDKRLAAEAEAAGAELRFPAGVTRVADDTVRFANGTEVRAKVIVGADGPVSTVARAFGYRVERTMFRMITATSAGEFPEAILLFFGSIAPGGYAWAIPKDGEANVGLGIDRVPPGARLDRLLDAFVRRESWAPVTDRTRWWVPIGPPPGTAVAGRALLVGDAANLVMATNGGGIPTAILSGFDAGTVAALHVRERTPLREYDALWKRRLYEPLDRAHRVQRLGERVAKRDWLLGVGMRYIGPPGLDAMMRLRWPSRLVRRAS